MKNISTSSPLTPGLPPALIDTSLRATYEAAQSSCMSRMVEYGNPVSDVHDRHRRRLVYAVTQVVLGNYEVARPELHALLDSACDDVAVVGEVIPALAQMGDVRVARDLAVSACVCFDRHPALLMRMMMVFESCLDFDAAHMAAATQLLRFGRDDPAREAIQRKATQYDILLQRASEHGIGKDELLCVAEFSVDALREHGKRIRAISLLGTTGEHALLQIEIDATLAECVSLDTKIGGAAQRHFYSTEAALFIPCLVLPFMDVPDDFPEAFQVEHGEKAW